MFLKTLFSFLLLVVAFCAAQDRDTMHDIQVGMQGLKEAAKDPAMLAQLIRDMQDPELMAEAQKMMNNPEYKKKMAELTKDKAFQESIKKTTDSLKDPNAAAAAEAKMEHMLKVGNDQLKKNAGDQMKEAMNAMSNPEVMAQMQDMLKDPKFMQQIQAMTKDPNFKSYVDAVQDMVKDPAMKAKFEQVGQKVKASM
ncbi:expressed unknown protein [Seminavis robusta]|uniref:Uncharacterized protein n=1 Tax=Seminavis robusta TaxID=568900 RepID=A0A9N8HMP7_9STRA|nr:expressed unknown protein [Seminavis robusta]|eukprot:Sro922_g220460.1 n/a (196) ;mRNA; f:4897-5743